jgi:hypothetical protein
MASDDELPPLTTTFAMTHISSSPSSSPPNHSASSDQLPLAIQTSQTVPAAAASSTSGSSSGGPHNPLASPKTHSSRPYPVILTSKFLKERSAAGAKTINGRLIMHALGEGATAEVTLCQDPQTGEYYALKKMSKRTLQKQKEYVSRQRQRLVVTPDADYLRVC